MEIPQVVSVDFKTKPGKIKCTLDQQSTVLCRVCYLTELQFDETEQAYLLGFNYPEKIDPVLDDDLCDNCEENERIALILKASL